MSDLKERLQRLKERGLGPGAVVSRQAALPEDVPGAEYVEYDSFFSCAEVGTPFGPAAVKETAHGHGEIYGNVRLGDLIARRFDLHGLDSERIERGAAGALFLDAETTGLAGGAGTYAFMIGAGFFNGSSFIVRQYFVRGIDTEAACLHLLASLLRGFETLVTFNGKCFDANLLGYRFVLNRIDNPILGMKHLDLLHLGRRIWRKSARSCALADLEEEVLGLRRAGDVPGSIIPEIYFRYQRTGASDLMPGVFRHNESDILAMTALLVHVLDAVSRPLALDRKPEELFCLGRAFLSRGREDGLAVLRAAGLAGATPIGREAMLLVAAEQKRRGNLDEAARIWERLTEEFPDDDAARVELMKLFEHGKKDPAAALRLGEGLRNASSESRRLERLRRKLSRRSR